MAQVPGIIPHLRHAARPKRPFVGQEDVSPRCRVTEKAFRGMGPCFRCLRATRKGIQYTGSYS